MSYIYLDKIDSVSIQKSFFGTMLKIYKVNVVVKGGLENVAYLRVRGGWMNALFSNRSAKRLAALSSFDGLTLEQAEKVQHVLSDEIAKHGKSTA